MTQQSLIGQTIGRYKVGSLLGRGGMATVYQAHDTVLRRDVALKILYAHFAADADSVERFEREAITAAGLEHPNIVPIYDVGHQGDLVYISMKLLTGQSLHDLLGSGQAIDPAQAVALAEQVAAALDYAHSKGVVHRDIKPANIFIERVAGEHGGSVRRAMLTDFGIAKSLGTPGTTSTGIIIGTPDYMAPEQIRGQPIDGRVDVYALGMVVYRALTGKLPFVGGVQEVLLAQLSEAPQPPSLANPRLPQALDAVLGQALAKNREERYGRAGELAAALRQALQAPPPRPDQLPTVVVPAGGATNAAPPRKAAGQPTVPWQPTPRQPPRVVQPAVPAAQQAVAVPDAASEMAAPAGRRPAWLLPAALLAIIAALAGALFVSAGGGGTPLIPAPSATAGDPNVVPPPITATFEPTAEPVATPSDTASAEPPSPTQAASPVPPTAPPSPQPGIATTVPLPPTATPLPPTATTTPLPPTATATATPLPLTATATAEPTATATAEPTATATAEPATTTPEDPAVALGCEKAWLAGGFGALWYSDSTVRDTLRCPTAAEAGGPGSMVQRRFEQGVMLWWRGEKTIYLLLDDGRWRQFDDTYVEGEELPPADTPPAGRYVPDRGFGKLWRGNQAIQQQIGYSTEPAEASLEGAFQPYEGGQMLFVADPTLGKQIALLYSSGTYEQRPDPTQ